MFIDDEPDGTQHYEVTAVAANGTESGPAHAILTVGGPPVSGSASYLYRTDELRVYGRPYDPATTEVEFRVDGGAAQRVAAGPDQSMSTSFADPSPGPHVVEVRGVRSNGTTTDPFTIDFYVWKAIPFAP